MDKKLINFYTIFDGGMVYSLAQYELPKFRIVKINDKIFTHRIEASDSFGFNHMYHGWTDKKLANKYIKIFQKEKDKEYERLYGKV